MPLHLVDAAGQLDVLEEPGDVPAALLSILLVAVLLYSAYTVYTAFGAFPAYSAYTACTVAHLPT